MDSMDSIERLYCRNTIAITLLMPRMEFKGKGVNHTIHPYIHPLRLREDTNHFSLNRLSDTGRDPNETHIY